ncbi:MAG: hypothetical protein IJ695_02820 [Butyrivibrio sp.]|nr:hypothetical protein [Butyrivibrio sp.]
MKIIKKNCKKNYKRIAALSFVLVILLSLPLALLKPNTVFAESEKTGYWQLKETNVTTIDDEIGEDGYEKDRYWILDRVETSGPGTVEGELYSSYGADAYMRAGGGDGGFDYNLKLYDSDGNEYDSFTNHVSWSSPPPRIEMGKEAEVGITVSFHCSDWEMDSSKVGFTMRQESAIERSELETADVNRFWKYESYAPGEEYYTVKDGVTYAPHNITIDKTIFPDTTTGRLGIEDLSEATWDISNERLIITAYDLTYDLDQGSIFSTKYIYKPNEAESGGDVVAGTEDNEVPFDQVTQDEYSDASDTTGEDQGTYIDDDIFRTEDEDTSLPEAAAVGGAGALIAGGSLAGLKKKKSGRSKKDKDKDKDEKKKNTSYKMFVSKDFGDAIQKGGKAVIVRARIDETDENGNRHARPLLTERITVTGEDLVIDSASMNGDWLEAFVRADAKNEADKGTIIFTLVASGGTFNNHITFRLVGEPELIFPKVRDDGAWLKTNQNPEVILIAGAGGESKVPFMFLDASAEPEEIRFITSEEITIKERRVEAYSIGYMAEIDNRTKEIEKENDIFAEMRFEKVTLEALFAGGVTVRGEFYIKIAPKGLSVLIKGGMNPLIEDKVGVREKLKEGYLEVLSYATRDENKVTLDPVIRPTGFDLCFAYVDIQGCSHLEMGKECFDFGPMQPTDEATANILAKYKYEIGTTGGFSVEPQNSLPELKEKYFVKLPVRAECDGFFENAEIPIRLLGEPADPLQDWKTELLELKLTVIRYFPEEYAHKRIVEINNNFNDPEIYDKSWLRAMRKSTIEAAQDYWTREYHYQQWLYDHYDIADAIFRKPPRFMADVALKIVFKYYFGENEGWISPVFGMCLDILDDVLWDFITEEEEDLDLESRIVDASLSAFENFISISEDSGVGINMGANPDKVKTFATFFVLWIIVDFYKRYTDMDPRDFYEALRKECIDMTGLAGRQFLGVALQRGMNSQAVQKFLKQKWVSQITGYLKKNLTPEMARIKGKEINGRDYSGKMKFARRINGDMELLNSEKLGDIGGFKEGEKYLNFATDGKSLDIESIDKVNTLLPAPGSKGPEFKTIQIDSAEVVTYMGIIETYIEDFFGTGIAYFVDPDKMDPQTRDFMNYSLFFDITVGGAKVSFTIAVDVLKLLGTVATGGLCPKAFLLIYDYLIGWYPFSSNSKKELSDDVGKEIGRLSKLPTAND